MLDNISFILIQPSHPGNIGASARAMKNMGLKHLILVQPQTPFPHAEITARAAGADSILQSVQIAKNLKEAIHGQELILGTSAEERGLPLERLTSREAGEFIISYAHTNKVAVLFGTERSGLDNKTLLHCNRQIIIPGNAEYHSLNLAAAVQVIAYEIFLSAWNQQGVDPQFRKKYDRLANSNEMNLFYEHLEATLRDIEFLNIGVEKRLIERLKRLFNRACLEKNEINILRGILKAVQRNEILKRK